MNIVQKALVHQNTTLLPATTTAALAQIQNLLATALKQNPGLVAQIRNNPALLANLQSALLRDQRSQQVTTSPNLNAFSSFGSLPKPQLQQPQQQPVDQCSALRRQNKRLKDLLHTLTADDITEVSDGVYQEGAYFEFSNGIRVTLRGKGSHCNGNVLRIFQTASLQQTKLSFHRMKVEISTL